MKTNKPVRLVLSQFLVAQQQRQIGAGNLVGDGVLTKTVRQCYTSPKINDDQIEIVAPDHWVYSLSDSSSDRKIIKYLEDTDSALLAGSSTGLKLAANLIYDVYDNSETAFLRHGLSLEDRRVLATVMDFHFCWIAYAAESPYMTRVLH